MIKQWSNCKCSISGSYNIIIVLMLFSSDIIIIDFAKKASFQEKIMMTELSRTAFCQLYCCVPCKTMRTYSILWTLQGEYCITGAFRWCNFHGIADRHLRRNFRACDCRTVQCVYLCCIPIQILVVLNLAAATCSPKMRKFALYKISRSTVF